MYRADSRHRAEVYAINAILREHEKQRFEAFRLEMESRGPDCWSEKDADDTSEVSSEVPSPDRPVLVRSSSKQAAGGGLSAPSITTADMGKRNKEKSSKSIIIGGSIGAV
jgi:hypothetical protein